MAHFMGIHAMQILPLVRFFVSKTDRQAGTAVVASAFALIGSSAAAAALFLAERERWIDAGGSEAWQESSEQGSDEKRGRRDDKGHGIVICDPEQERGE